MFAIEIDALANLLRQARLAYPREACGLLVGAAARGGVRLSVLATETDRNTAVSFLIQDAAVERGQKALRSGETLCGVFHSHILGPARPSRRDRAGARTPGELWLIYSLRFRDLKLYEWDGGQFTRKRLRFAAN